MEISKYWLDIIGLTNRADDNAGDLPYGDQRKLEIVRAMCIEPHLLCLDAVSYTHLTLPTNREV